jgi:SDR family mycofactocin-dependent oxidoreductase
MTRTAIITGAGRGIGAAVADRLAVDGWNLVLIDDPGDDPAIPYSFATREDLEKVAERCGTPAMVASADVRDQAALDAATAEAIERFGAIDAAVAAAGAVAGGAPAWATDDATWTSMLDINLTGPWRLARAVLPAMVERGEGRFVAVGSTGSVMGLPNLAAYAAAKHGVAGLVRSLAAELGSTGVTANAVLPGSTRTTMLEASADAYGLQDPEEFAVHHRTERLIEPHEIAETIAWICSDAPPSLTGSLISVDGGMTSG